MANKEEKMVIIHKKVTELIPYINNARTHSEDQIIQVMSSIKEFRFANPILLDGDNGIIAGHCRLLAAQRLKMSEVPCIEMAHLSEAQKKAYILADNQIATNSDWDLELLGVEFETLKELEFDLDLLGFDPSFINGLLEPLDETGLTDDDAVPPLPEETAVQPGDVWLCGEHRVMCGDSAIIDQVDTLMMGKKADLLMTDPPYQIDTQGGCKGRIGGELRKQGSDIEFISEFDPVDFLSVLPILFESNKCNAYIFCNKALLPDYLVWARDNNISFNVLVWKKPSGMPIGDSHRPDIEYLLLFRRSAIWNNGLKDVNYSRVIEEKRELGLHPTMKPVALLENEIKISSHQHSLVVDLFGGAGSTLIACEKTHRINYIMEIEPRWVAVILERWASFSGQDPILESTGQTYQEICDLEVTDGQTRA